MNLNLNIETSFTALLFIGALISLYVLISGHRKHIERLRGSRSPFVEDFLRLPGHTTRLLCLEKFDELTERYNQFLLFSFLLVLSTLLLHSVIGIVCFVLAITGVVATSVKTWKLYAVIQDVILVCDGEEYTGQELNYLWSEGAAVYHDIPYADGRIDHIVIGRDKVFVVETYVVTKTLETSGSQGLNSVVEFDGENLVFPSFQTTAPIEMAINHARYLQQQIRDNVGIDYQVMPVVTIPGWHVKITTKQKAETLVINPKRGAGLKAWLGKLKEPGKRKPVVDYLSTVARSIPPRSRRTDSYAGKEYDFWLSPRFRERIFGD